MFGAGPGLSPGSAPIRETSLHSGFFYLLVFFVGEANVENLHNFFGMA